MIAKKFLKLYFLLGLLTASIFLLHPQLKLETILVRCSGIYGVIGIWVGLFRSRPQPRWGWRFLAIGAVINIVGDFFYTEMYYINNPILDPTVGVFIYVFGMLCSIGGLGLVIFSIRHQITRDSLIQGLIITTGFFSLIWLVQIGPSMSHSKDLFEWVKDAVIPLGLVVAIAIGCVPLATPTGRTWSFRLTFLASLFFVLGAFLQSIGTTGWPTPFADNGPGDLVYFSDMSFALAYLTLALAILHPSIHTFHNPLIHLDTFARDDIYLLGISFFLTPVAFLVQYIRSKPSDPIFVIVSSCVIFLLVMLRLSSLFKIVFLQNLQLNQQRQDLHYLAFHDKLTGLPNRTFLDNLLEQAFKRVHPDRLGAVLMIDVNHFKAINDTFGHHVGDRVLCEIAQQLTEFKRHTDVVGRWGGDEFLFILEGLQSAQDALTFAQRLSSLVRVTRVQGELVYPVSLSIGVCMFPPNKCDIPTILKHADQALYQAKSNDQNKVAVCLKDGEGSWD